MFACIFVHTEFLHRHPKYSFIQSILLNLMENALLKTMTSVNSRRLTPDLKIKIEA